MKTPLRFHVVIEQAEEGGYVAQCVEIPGAISEGDTLPETLDNVSEAIRDVLEVRRQQARRRVRSQPARRLTTVDVDA